jgi:hypothetical protein
MEKNNIVKTRLERQEYNNKLAFDAIKLNAKNPDKNNINKKALDRLLTYTNYKNIDELIKDRKNYEKIILELSSLYIAKNASRQGTKDENIQLENINILQKFDIIIEKDGKYKPIKGGGIRKSDKKQIDELKSIDFVIKYKKKIIGYITAKTTSGRGGHQDNVLDEIKQFCEWSLIQIQNNNKIYIVLYDNQNISKLFNDIKKKDKTKNLIFTDTKNFKDDFLSYFTDVYL